jgi:copper chaperone
MKTVLKVQGMTCEHCKSSVMEALRRLDRRWQVRVDLKEQRVEVLAEDEAPDPRQIRQAIEELGFTVR